MLRRKSIARKDWCDFADAFFGSHGFLLLLNAYFCSMKWIGERISFIDDQKRTTFVIYPESKGWQKSLMGAWFCMWLAIGATMSWSLSLKLTQQEQIIVVIFLIFWVYYAVRVGRAFFWLMWGKEMLKIDETALFLKKSIRGYGKSVPYYLENISKIRLQQPKENSIQAVWEASPWIKGGERLEFDYMGKTIRFARKISEKEAKLLFNLVTKRIDERLRAKKD